MAADRRSESCPWLRAVEIRAESSFAEQDPPKPRPASRNVGAMRLPSPIPTATSSLSAPTRSQMRAISSMKPILVARNALQAFHRLRHRIDSPWIGLHADDAVSEPGKPAGDDRANISADDHGHPPRARNLSPVQCRELRDSPLLPAHSENAWTGETLPGANCSKLVSVDSDEHGIELHSRRLGLCGRPSVLPSRQPLCDQVRASPSRRPPQGAVRRVTSAWCGCPLGNGSSSAMHRVGLAFP
jgi:hypothetical protein